MTRDSVKHDGFRISARTVLELGADLISSDAVAIYELVKNAIDARSKSGVEVHFYVTLGHTAFVECMEEIERAEPTGLQVVKEKILGRVEPTSAPEMVRAFRDAVSRCDSLPKLKRLLPELYKDISRIEFRDTGHGMSAFDLHDHYLLIGTPFRKDGFDQAQDDARDHPDRTIQAPYLGEKGLGRLSAMRLGSHLHVATATTSDERMNVLKVNWNDFRSPGKLVEDIKIAPEAGGPKPTLEWSGTIITISGLEGNWSPRRIRDAALAEFSRLADPFSLGKKRFRIAIFFNGDRVDIPRLDDELLRVAHASVKAVYEIHGSTPVLDVEMMFKGPERVERKRLHLGRLELGALVDDPDEGIPRSSLRTLGPFQLEAYWYNRQRLAAVDSIGDLATVRELQKRWAGIMLFRDGYRVYPYGAEHDDWLGLDRKALGSGGYKLNKIQFIGRVSISRLLNSYLVDQTNREGLKDCPEQSVFVGLLRYVLQELLKNFMEEVNKQQRHVDVDLSNLEDRIASLQARATQAVQHLKRRHSESRVELKDVLAMFDEMKESFDRARLLAEQAEEERERLIQLAGVGLMLEVVAHELARSTETALKMISEVQREGLPEDLTATLKTLRHEMQTINKRLRVLDPLSVSARQRREICDLAEIVRDSLAGRSRQLERHHIRSKVHGGPKAQLVVNGVKGMYVQIVENLLSNSVFWLNRRFVEEPGFEPEINVRFDSSKRVVEFSDNGPGISDALKDEVFKPFFSTKDKRRRQGLGLYIARECAAHNGARLLLSEKHSEHEDRLNTFLLELPEQ
jgi:signal transduction histidine kinase